MAVTDSTVGTVVGALMVGSSTNLALYGMEVIMLYYYWSTFPNDHIILKGMVLLASIVDTLCTIIEVVCVYGYAITNFGNYEAMAVQGFEIPTYLVCTAIATAIAQGYLTWRLFRLSKNMVLAAFLGLCIAATFVTDIMCAHIISQFNSLTDRNLIRAACISWLTLAASTDVLLAGFLIYFLATYGRQTSFQDTRSILRKIMVVAAESGSFTSILALSALAFYLIAPANNICTSIGFNLGRGYTLTLLFNLSIRGSHKNGSSAGTGHIPNTGIETFKLGQRGTITVQKNQGQSINVAKETHVRIDKDDDFNDAGSYPFKIVEEDKEDNKHIFN